MGLGPQSRIAVAGAGSIGCYVGGCLALAGRNVRLLMRPALADAIAHHGLRVSGLDGMDQVVAADRLGLATDPALALADADVVLITVKSGATGEMAHAIAQHGRRDAIVVSLQNGVGNVDVLGAHVGARPVVAGMVPFNVVQSREESGRPHVHRASSGTLLIGSGIEGLRQLLDVPGVGVAEHPDMRAVLWGKLLFNMNNALVALSGLPLAAQLADRRWRLLLAAQIEEALAVLKASRIRPARIEGVQPRLIPYILRLPDGLFRIVARRMLAIDPEARSSMWEDLERRRPTEIDYLQGAIVALAARAGVSAPMSTHITRLIKEAERGAAGSPRLAPEQVARQAAATNDKGGAAWTRM